MARKKIQWYDIGEASVVGGISGFQLPIGAKGKKKKNPSKPFGEPELFEHSVIQSELNESDLDETIRQVEGEWVIFDPRTGAQVGKASSRDAAREKQRQLGITQQKSPDHPQGAAIPAPSPISGPEPAKPKKKKKSTNTGGFEEVKKLLKRTLKEAGVPAAKVSFEKVQKALSSATSHKLAESSMISYVFEQSPPDTESIWESFITKLKREHVMSDPGLNESIRSIAMAEARVLAQSVMEVKKLLEGTKSFFVERCEADQDPETGDIRMPFKVTIVDPTGLGENKDLLFGVKLEHGKPLILFPEESRSALNNMLTKESKLLRAELMHVQETALDKFDEVIQASAGRDTYLSEMHTRLSEMIEGLNLVEASIMKNIVRKKLKGAK